MIWRIPVPGYWEDLGRSIRCHRHAKGSLDRDCVGMYMVHVRVLNCQSGSCRCAIIGVPWCLRRLSLFTTCLSNIFDKQAKHAETDPMAHLRWHTSNHQSVECHRHTKGSLVRDHFGMCMVHVRVLNCPRMYLHHSILISISIPIHGVIRAPRNHRYDFRETQPVPVTAPLKSAPRSAPLQTRVRCYHVWSRAECCHLPNLGISCLFYNSTKPKTISCLFLMLILPFCKA